MVKIQTVTSKNLAAVAYNPTTQQLMVTFKNRRAYVYSAVEVEVMNELLEASSKGSYFNKNIRDNYPFVPFRSEEDAARGIGVDMTNYSPSTPVRNVPIRFKDALRIDDPELDLFAII